MHDDAAMCEYYDSQEMIFPPTKIFQYDHQTCAYLLQVESSPRQMNRHVDVEMCAYLLLVHLEGETKRQEVNHRIQEMGGA